MSSILNVLRSAPTPTRHFTSLQIVSSVKSQSSAFNPEHHPIVLQQLVESLSPKSYLASSSTASAVKESFSGKAAAKATAGTASATTPASNQNASDKL
ncbi:hypothetical protein EMPS_02783 [Entomortierella parvispora]|uniref:Uncharacterized protein n=1 Tax=Entomortierella parvispora TaxID=205924 RepID=A0A9P3LU02_9FUNG|nr:hypothetical protein EMPS_02783 [Entomortierella parvispora]